MAPGRTKTAELSPAKREQILEGARRAFTEHGFERASVDRIAAMAGVSKATVYNHFRDKKALFSAAIVDVTAQLRCHIDEILAAPTGQAELDLQRVGEHFLQAILAPTSVALHRALMAEVGRFPELGAALHQHVACTMRQSMAGYIRRLHLAGALDVADPELASKQFLALCQVDLLSQCQLGVLEHPSLRDIRASVKTAVRTFLRAYRP
jgi:TetR/AcrR family transcriptional regulator, mexJK operon transcriptional repressor